MPVLVEDLDATWEEIELALALRGVLRYPSIPSAKVVASWPDADWAAFLDVAAAAGARMVYATAAQFDTDDVEGLRSRLVREDGTLSSEAEEVVVDAAARAGSLVVATLGFVVDGVLHVWHGQAAWWDQVGVQAEVEEMHAAIEATERTAAEEAEWASLEGSVDVWAADLAEDPRFWRASNEDLRRTVAGDVVPDLAPLLGADRSTPAGRRLHSLGLTAVRQATRLVRTDVLPRLEAEAYARLEVLADALGRHESYDTTATKEQRRRAARAYLLDEVGHATAALVDALIAAVASTRTS